MSTLARSRVISGPPGFPTRRVVAKLRHGGMVSADFRRAACRMNPILFALYYLEDHLRSKETGEVSLSEFHIALARAALRWARTDVGPEELRDAWVAPREGAKSTWLLLVLALWALAYGHRSFVLAYADTDAMARLQLLSLKMELSGNAKLNADFPDLCRPMRRDGKTVMNTQSAYLAESGAAIIVKGMDAAALGAKIGHRRPDLLLFDDIEPKEGDYSVELAQKRLNDLVEAVFPMNLRAVVQIAGTTVMHGSIIHQLIEGKPWVREENIKVHHFRAIVTDPMTGEERSLWPQKWSLEYLRARRHTRKYQKNFDNEPVSADGTYWSKANDDITYDPLTSHLTHRILVIDPAAKSKKSSDETGIGQIAFAADLQRAVVERVTGVRLGPAELRERVHALLRANPTIRVILLDVTNGGEHVENTLKPLPAGVKIEAKSITGKSKAGRFEDLLDRYQRQPREVVHARPIPGVEEQMYAYPATKHDDRIDVVALGVEYLFEKYGGRGRR